MSLYSDLSGSVGTCPSISGSDYPEFINFKSDEGMGARYRRIDSNDSQTSTTNAGSFMSHGSRSSWMIHIRSSRTLTMSNLPGPGRLLGNLFSIAGQRLEENLGAAVNDYNVRRISTKIRKSWKNQSIKDRCKFFVQCAGSKNPSIQAIAFKEILHIYEIYWREDGQWIILRDAVKAQHSPSTSESSTKPIWRRASFEYNEEWELYYKVVKMMFADENVDKTLERLLNFNCKIGEESTQRILAICSGPECDRIVAKRLLRLLWKNLYGRTYGALKKYIFLDLKSYMTSATEKKEIPADLREAVRELHAMYEEE
ncbi:hypothetical protein SCHPADRAFT_903246 [Schizopora paradoxa]|uniref:Uncharacterized protein n=1 Tax=Schizopora paradoxa TaxID=27342 RepID=A0A0H2RYK6_9AGAM|nr:hypothetical protein SCHPADRAFT_903246 [Schizopora paradoxa]